MKLRNLLGVTLALTMLSLSSFAQKLTDGIYAKFTTDKGTVLVKLYAKEAPMTVANFVGLAEGDFKVLDSTIKKPFYDGLTFHRVISKANGDKQDFMIQGGDPKGTGEGGPGYKFFDEIVDSLQFTKPGLKKLSNVNTGM